MTVERCRAHSTVSGCDGYHVCIIETGEHPHHLCICGHAWPNTEGEP